MNTEPTNGDKKMTEKKTIKVGSKVTVGKVEAVIQAMRLPKMTLQMNPHNTKVWRDAIRDQVVRIYEHSFVIKSVSGNRLYLELIEVEESE